MAYANKVYRVAKIEKEGLRYTIDISIKGIEYPTIGKISVKKILSQTSLTDNNNGKIQHLIRYLGFDDNIEMLVFDIVISPVGFFTISNIEEFPNGKIEEYVVKE